LSPTVENPFGVALLLIVGFVLSFGVCCVLILATNVWREKGKKLPLSKALYPSIPLTLPLWIQETFLGHQLLVISVGGTRYGFTFAATGFGGKTGLTGTVKNDDPTRGTVARAYPPLTLTPGQAQTAAEVVAGQVRTEAPYLIFPLVGVSDCRTFSQQGCALFQKVFGR
jgi:hypothetical protein